MTNIFEQAVRQKLRFDTAKGSLSVEDLWDLPLSSATGKANLDDIAIGLHKQLRSASEVVSFVDTQATTDPTIQLRFDVVKHVIETRKLENAKAANERQRAETKQRLLAALAKKREDAIDAKSEEELLAELAAL